MGKINVDWVLASERLPAGDRLVHTSNADGSVSLGRCLLGCRWSEEGITHWAEIEQPDPPEQNMIETRAKITRMNNDGYSHEVVFIADVPGSFMGKTLKVRIEKA